jgi:hypothetical protein
VQLGHKHLLVWVQQDLNSQIDYFCGVAVPWIRANVIMITWRISYAIDIFLQVKFSLEKQFLTISKKSPWSNLTTSFTEPKFQYKPNIISFK